MDSRQKRAENQHRYKGNEYSEPIWQLEINAEHDHRKRPKHGEVPLSEIDHVCGPVNEHESKRDQGINTADAKAGEEKLEGYAHRHCACSGQGMPLSAHILYSRKSICLMNTILPL